MRRFVSLLLLLSLLTACAKPAESPTVQPQEEPIPIAEVLAPSDARLRAASTIQISTARSARIYTGRGQWYLTVAELPAGIPLELLESREGWFQVRLDSGEIGWLSSADAAITDSADPDRTYQIRSGRWELESPDGMAVRASRAATGVMRVTIEGLPNLGDPVRSQEGNVALFTGLPGLAPAVLPIGDSGLESIAVTEEGLLITLESDLLHQVVSGEPGSLHLEFRPGLSSVAQAEQGWLIQMRGDLRPVLREADGQLVVDLPGAVTTPDYAGLPPGLHLEAVAPEEGAAPALNQLNAAIPSRMPAGGLRIRFPVPDSPYALYRTGPGQLELRVLPRGLAGKLIVLDPGHGGEETGAFGPGGTIEKDINLAVAHLLGPMLEQAGARVIMTRTEDQRVLPAEEAAKLASHSERTQRDLAARSAMANAAGADLFLSIHGNGGVPGEGGIETFWTIPNLNAARSLKLAELVQEELLDALGLANRGVKQRPFNVIRYSEAPAVLAELGFVTHPAEERLLTSPSGQQASAEALFRAIQRYFEEW